MPRKITEERRREAARLVLEGGLRSGQVARQLGLSKSSVERYVASYRPAEREELGVTEREELRRLRREGVELRMERDFLKKATAYFAKVHV